MAKRYFKNLKRLGQKFCIYNVCKTGISPVYTDGSNTYFKPRNEAIKGNTIQGITNMVLCKPMQIGTLTGYIEIN